MIGGLYCVSYSLTSLHEVFHIYDSNLTGSQKLLMTLLLIDNTYDIYTLSCLAKRPTEDVIFDLQELKKRGYFQDR